MRGTKAEGEGRGGGGEGEGGGERGRSCVLALTEGGPVHKERGERRECCLGLDLSVEFQVEWMSNEDIEDKKRADDQFLFRTYSPGQKRTTRI